MYTLIRLYLLTGDNFDELKIADILSATESKRSACKSLFENQLFGYYHYHYCTKININCLLLNTCNFHRKFRFIFSLNLSKNMQNVHFREAKFQNFPGEHAPGPPSVLVPLAVDPLLPPGLLLPIGSTQYNITYLNYTKRCFLFQ